MEEITQEEQHSQLQSNEKQEITQESETGAAEEQTVNGEKSSSKSTEIIQDDDDLPPKVNSELEVLHENVTKQIIKTGHGNKPTPNSTCFLHYRAWTERTMHKFEDTWREQQPLELVLGREKKVLCGLAIGVASMRAGERALFHVGWQLAYGEEGNFSFPNVPPQADLIYEVELIGFEEAKEGKPRSDMTVEERIEAADRRRKEGNEFFKEGKLAEAMHQYEMALAYMGDDFMFQLFGKYKDMANAVKNPCHLNMAACLLKLNRYEEVIGQCNMVLVEDESNVKALFRRGKARAALGQTDTAREDFQKVKKFSPEDKAVAKELHLLAQHDKELYMKQKELYKGLFGPRPEPKPKRLLWLVVFWQWFVSIIRTIFRIKRSKDD
uniref:peptidylprolyl isomerase n=1 Tax=Araucaria cunninghamii TaxID=56994 RepID=A0A0D6QY77_ARACU